MADEWYRTPEWTEADEQSLQRRLNRYKKLFDRAQVLRIKASALCKTDNPTLIKVAERLLCRIVEDPEARPGNRLPGDVSIAYDMLGKIACARGDLQRAEQMFRNGLAISNTPGSGLTLATFLARFGPDSTLGEASTLLDEVAATTTPPQLLFRHAKLNYAASRARINWRLKNWQQASEFAEAALGLANSQPIDSFKRKPLDALDIDCDTMDELRRYLRVP